MREVRGRPHWLAWCRSGFTLVELMVVLAIGGGLSLALATLMAQNATVQSQMSEEGGSTRDVQTFFWFLEQYIGQTTQVLKCDCRTANNTCVWDPTAADAAFTGAPAGITFRAIYEDADDPILEPQFTAECMHRGTATLPGSTIAPRGCKRVVELVFTPPVAESGATPSTPGKLQLRLVDDQTLATTDIMELRNVTRFDCGMGQTVAGSGVPNNREFRVRVDTKIKKLRNNDPAASDYESWHPNGTQFAFGTQLSFASQINFRNLTIPGVQFGKVRSYRNCIRWGAAGSGQNRSCCSGYWDGTDCIQEREPNTGGCLRAQDAGAAAATVAANCCSRMLRGGAGPGCL